jgi:hypothetical protein
MATGLRRLLSWSIAAAAVFFLIPPVLFHLYPSSFWGDTDYQPLGLADALNMAYRIADLHIYRARGLEDHPGIPFYFTSWLALALTGYPVAWRNSGFFEAVINHVEIYHQITIWLGALTGAAGVYIFMRTVRPLVPGSVAATGLMVWLFSTPATLSMFLSPSIDSFAMLINALFLAVLVRAAHDDELRFSAPVLSAAAGAFAYLNKLPYIYVVLALAATGLVNFGLRRANWKRAGLHVVIFVVTFLMIVMAVGMAVLRRDGFHDLIEFHKLVFHGTGMYGTGEQAVVSSEAVWRALAEIPKQKAYAVFIALLGGPALVVVGFAAGLRNEKHIPVAVIAMGAGLASLLSAVAVLKHYDLHYTAGVSATLPSSVVAAYLLLRSWDWRVSAAAAAIAAIAALFMASESMPLLVSGQASKTAIRDGAKVDYEVIRARLASEKGVVEYVYHAPFAAWGEGFLVIYGAVPRMTDAYLQGRTNAISSQTAGLIDLEVGAYVIDKSYFRTAESIRTASNIALLSPKPATMHDGDELIELRTSFLLIRR